MGKSETIRAEIERVLGQQVSEVRLRLALDAARMGVWERNLATGEDIWSVQQEALFHLPPGSFAATHKAFLDMVHPEDREALEEAARRALAGQAAYQSEYRAVLPDGTVRWMTGRGDVVRDAEGRPTHMVGITMDVHDRKLAEEERQRLLASEQAARGEAEVASRLKDEFLATVSHELRTPLNAILGWAQLLAGGEEDPAEVRHGLRAIERNAKAMAQLVEDVLDVSRVIQGRLRLDVRPVQLGGVIDAALDAVQPAATAKGIRLQRVADLLPRPVSGDPDRLQQVVWNLLSNAIKFTPAGGMVQVRLEQNETHARVRVVDTGTGIEPEFLPHLFERFTQADPSTRRVHAGLGLGLAIVRHLVELHGGTVRAESDGPGRGASFIVELPLLAEEPPEPSAAPSSEGEAFASAANPPAAVAVASTANGAAGCLQGIKVLVVDDEEDARELIGKVLRRHGADVTAVSSAGEAVAHLRGAAADVLLSDLAMPAEDGYDLIRQVRQIGAGRAGGGRNLAAAAVTSLAGPENRDRALRAGYQVHVAKPVEPAELVAVVANLAGRG